MLSASRRGLFAAFTDHERFAFSYLFAYIGVPDHRRWAACSSASLQRLTSAGWSVTIRRTHRVPALAALGCSSSCSCPSRCNLDQLYPLGHGERPR